MWVFVHGPDWLGNLHFADKHCPEAEHFFSFTFSYSSRSRISVQQNEHTLQNITQQFTCWFQIIRPFAALADSRGLWVNLGQSRPISFISCSLLEYFDKIVGWCPRLGNPKSIITTVILP